MVQQIKSSVLTASFLILLLPLFLTGYLIASSSLHEINITKKQQAGAAYHHELFKLLIATEAYRGHTHTRREDEYSEEKLKLIDQIGVVDNLSPLAMDMGVYEDWQSLRVDLSDMIDHHEAENIHRHFHHKSEVTGDLMKLMKDVADQSTLILDPEFATYYMVNILANIIPVYVETIADIRAELTGELSRDALTLQNKKELYQAMGRLEDLLLDYTHSLKVIERYDNYHEASTPEDHQNAKKSFVDIINQFREMTKNGNPVYDKERLYQYLSASKDSFVFVYQKFNDDLDYHLEKRIDSERNRMLLTLFGLLIAVLLAFAYGIRLAKSARGLEIQAREYLELKNAAVAASQAKTDFLANMSHELRTPLNSIIGLNQLIDVKKLDPGIRDHFLLIRASAQSLLAIVNDILDLSKIEAGAVMLEDITFNPGKQIYQLVESLKPLASKKGLLLSYNPPVFLYRAVGDSHKLSRILTNILTNAIRYTEEGAVELNVATHETSPAHFTLRCEIKDTGIGIPPEKISQIFEKFMQADSSHSRKYGGTGLGLTITRELVEIMNGQIGVESIVGKGTLFWIEIPFKIAPEAEIDFIDHTPSQDNNFGAIPVSLVRILLAEDHEMNQIFMKKFLSNLGIPHFDLARNGREAVNMAQSNNYDLILMDCHMPEMSGYDATVAIRSLPNPFMRDVPIIGLTANAMPQDEQRCLDLGMNAYISKPIDIDIFKEKLAPWVKFDAPDEGQVRNPLNTEKILDTESLRKNSGNDEAFMRDMAVMFAAQGQAQIDKLKTLCLSGMCQEWVDECHALKGTAGNIGAMMMRQTCGEAQDMLDATAYDRLKILTQIEEQFSYAQVFLIKEGLLES